MFLPDHFLEAWLPSDFDVDTAAPILAILMVSLLFAQPGHLLAQFLVARGRHGRLAVARLATVAVNLLLSIGLALWVGLWGVAVATLVTEALSVTVVLPYLLRRESSASLRGAGGRVAEAGRARRPGGDPDPARSWAASSISTRSSSSSASACAGSRSSARLSGASRMREPERRTISEAFGRGSSAVAAAEPPLL